MRKCNKCGAEVDNRKVDPCIGEYLEGIAFACCGHGKIKSAYCVGWKNCRPNIGPDSIHRSEEGYFCYRGQEALDYMESLK